MVMRLLKLDRDTQRLAFTKNLFGEVPPYAILSHTWGDFEEEVTYKDIMKGRGKDKEGYRKIEFCLGQSSLDGIDYVWVDSCCIDKSSSTELQQSINSMFRWYQNALKCYVYLSDVSINTPSQEGWKSAFRKTKWATRGWTLQELLAPSTVEFYSSEGQLLGDKESLESMLHVMTGISIKALRGAPHCEFSELERMSWMESRETTHPEDLAYALLGLFDIQMPLIYGEGKRNAFFRLREEIALRTGRVRPVTDEPKVHDVMPFGRNVDFVGRESILDKLMSKIPPGTHSDTCQTTVIEGLGGVGKTQIALEAAYRVREIEPESSIFWVPAVDKMTIENAYRKIGQSMEIPQINDIKVDVMSLVKEALSEDNIGPWLLVIDNADDIDLMFGQGDQLSLHDHLPSNPKGSILFTTRNHEVTVSLDVGRDHILTVEEMDLREAMQLLQKKLAEVQLQDVESTHRLLEFLTYLPLAIRQASAYMSRTNISTTTYLEYCNSSDATEIAILSQHFEDRSRYRHDKSANPIATTWLISFRHIANKHPLASRYLKFISYLAEKDIPISLLPKYGGGIERDAAIGVLKNYAFINARDESDSFDIHRLVRLAACNWVKQEQGNHLEDVIRHLSSVYPDPSGGNKATWLRYLPHGDVALDSWTRQNHDDIGWKLMINVGQSHFILGKPQLAEMRFRQASEVSEMVQGPEHPNTIASYNGLSTMLRQQAKYSEAEQLQRQILRSSTKMLGPEHPHTLAVTNGLAEVLRQSGRYPQAEETQKQTLHLCSRVLGEDHPSTFASMNNLAIVHYQQGDCCEAELQCRQLLHRKTECLAPKHVDILSTMNSLGVILDLQGRYKQSEIQHRQTLQLSTEIWGADHAETMASVTNLASVLYRQERYEEAEELHRRAILANTRELSDDHPDTLANTNGLAEVLRQRGYCQEAEQLHRRTLQFVKKTLGPEHPSTLMVSNNLAATLLQQGDCDNAEKLFRHSLQLKIKVLGPEHPATFASLHGLANVLLHRKRYWEAEQQYKEVLERRANVLGAHHPLTITTANDLAAASHLRRRQEVATLPTSENVRPETIHGEHITSIGSLTLKEVTSEPNPLSD